MRAVSAVAAALLCTEIAQTQANNIKGNDAASISVLVTGATGRTGRLLYQQLKVSPVVKEVRAFVTNLTEAAEYLNCTKCDASEGIYVGDVTNISTLVPAVQGVNTVAIAVGAGSGEKTERDVDFHGVENSVTALATQPNLQDINDLQVVLCSSMGTTWLHPLPFMGGSDLFFKLNAEAFLLSSGVKTTIVKPCGLADGDAAQVELLVGHDDALLGTLPPTIPRADVARLMTYAVENRIDGLRYDVCSKEGTPTTDLGALMQQAKYPWTK